MTLKGAHEAITKTPPLGPSLGWVFRGFPSLDLTFTVLTHREPREMGVMGGSCCYQVKNLNKGPVKLYFVSHWKQENQMIPPSNSFLLVF